MPVSAADLKILLAQVKSLVEQLEGLHAKAEQEELSTGRIGTPAARLTRKA